MVDIDVHFGNGTAELLRHDPRAFFASVHMVYGAGNRGVPADAEGSGRLDRGGSAVKAAQANGFYPAHLGATEITDNYVSVGVFPAVMKASRRRPVEAFSSDSSSDDEDSVLTAVAAVAAVATVFEETVTSGDGQQGGEQQDGHETKTEGAILDTEEGKMAMDYDDLAFVSASADSMVTDEGQVLAAVSLSASASMDSLDAVLSMGGSSSTIPISTLSTTSTHPGPVVPPTPSESSKQAGPGPSPSVGALRGSAGYRRALSEIIIPQMEKFQPQLLIISGTSPGRTCGLQLVIVRFTTTLPSPIVKYVQNQ